MKFTAEDYMRQLKEVEESISSSPILQNIVSAHELYCKAIDRFVQDEFYDERTERFYPRKITPSERSFLMHHPATVVNATGRKVYFKSMFLGDEA